jgi:hypothetical protein
MSGKPAVRLYPVDIDLLPLGLIKPDATVTRRLLTAEKTTGAATSLVYIAGGASWLPDDIGYWTELWVCSGTLRTGSTVVPAGSYYCIAPDGERPELSALEDSVVMWFSDLGGSRMQKGEVRLLAPEIAALPSTRPEGAAEGVLETILAAGDGGSVTRLLRVLPYVSTGVFVHDHSEEVFLLTGSYKMGDEFHPTGTYTCKGPGVSHGPFLTSTGYLGLEVRNFAQRGSE